MCIDHKNRLLKNKINKILRESGFIRYQQHHTNTENHAFKIEIALIKKYGRRDNKTGILCNMTNGGEGVAGYKRSESWKEQSRQRNILNSKGYDQYTKNDHFIRSFETLNELRQKFPKLDTGALSMCVNNKIRSTIGFRWTWRDNNIIPWEHIRKQHKQHKQHKHKQHKQHTGRSVNQFLKSGQFIKNFSSLVEAGSSINKHPNTILECCRGRSKTAGGYVWTYE